jgi:hypothetical protein
VLGHILLALPYVVLIVQARMVGISRTYEEAALSLGAPRCRRSAKSRCRCSCRPSWPACCWLFTISFDNTSASLFWRPPGVETMPTQILAMLKISISPEINALGTVMILVTVGIPSPAELILGAFYSARRRSSTTGRNDENFDRPSDWSCLSERYREWRHQPPHFLTLDRGRGGLGTGVMTRMDGPRARGGVGGAFRRLGRHVCRRRSTNSPSSPTPRRPASRWCKARSATRTRSSPR